MLIALINSVYTYYFQEYEDGMPTGEDSFSDLCDELADEGDVYETIYCHPMEQEKYQFLGGFLLFLGLTIVCLAKDSDTTKQVTQSIPVMESQQPTQQQYTQQPPLH